MRIGVLADVHGNSLALDAVLADASGRGIDRWLNAGDCVFGPLDPAGTSRRLRALDALTVQGNQDRVLTVPQEAEASPTEGFVREALGEDDLAWLASLPVNAVEGEIHLCHGTPRDDEEPLVERIGPHGVSIRPASEIQDLLAEVSASVVICGHTHVSRAVRVGRFLVLNPGSVGLPAYTDEAPFPHGMEAGSPHARYAVLTAGAAGWTVEQIAVPYNWETAARWAEARGRPDWAAWIRTGRA